MTNSVYPNQGIPKSGSTLLASILKFVSNVVQLFAADGFSRRHFQMHFSWRFKDSCPQLMSFSIVGGTVQHVQCRGPSISGTHICVILHFIFLQH